MDRVHSHLGWRTSWPMVFWAAAILHCSFHVTQAEVNPIQAVPSNPIEGEEVLLSPLSPPDDDALTCTWSRERTGQLAQIIVTLVLLEGGTNKTGPEYTGRETIYRNCSLHIKELILNDSAIYILSVGGTGSSDIGNINLTVQVFVRKPNVIILPAPFVVESQEVWIRCNTTVTGDIRWFKDGDLLPDVTPTIHIASATRDDTGEYKCQVSDGAVESDPRYLSVIYGPDIPIIPPTEVCNEEDVNIILDCKAASCPEPQYSWFRDSKKLDEGPKLFIEHFNESKAGLYICKARNELLHKETVSAGQHIRLTKSCVHDVSIVGVDECTEGETISLNCTAEGDDIEYSWSKGGQPLNENNPPSLNFDQCNRKNAGQYICHAFNDYSSGDSDPFNLTIIYGPDPPFINETIDITEETITLTCVAVAHPPTKNKWFYNGVLIPDTQVVIRNITAENSGKYTCQATNPRSGLQRDTTLEIDMIKTLKKLRRR